MKTKKKLKMVRLFYLIPLLFFLLLTNCTSSDLKVSEFKFEYNNKQYTIRSTYCPNNPESCNQIMGKDIVAVDLNQDRVIDKIIMGNYSLAEAQKIYDFCLESLEKQNKLNRVNSAINGYYVVDREKDFEIRTMNTELKSIFNEFKIIEKKDWGSSLIINVYVDNNSNGQLDERIKGEISLADAQDFYSTIINRGLSERELIKVNNIITVK